ncbi:hypothetical protein DAC16_24 [Bacteroides phage DAC16]|nr:hypothetical protein DAC16_24 [Bacteroides phage DAC16]
MDLNEEVYARTTRSLKSYPLGSKFRAISGGYWEKVENGFKWCTGDTFPNLGGDWDGTVSMKLSDLLKEYNNDYFIKYLEKRIKELELSVDNLFKEEIKKIVEKRDKYIDDIYKELKFRNLI